MLLTGILLGPHMLNLLQDSILSISGELRQMALIVILIKAGLSLNLNDLKKVGRPAVMMAFVPATFELLGFCDLCADDFRNKPDRCGSDGRRSCCCFAAVVVPRMVMLMEEKYGTKKSIPQMILAGASCDDIYVLSYFHRLYRWHKVAKQIGVIF